MNNDHEELKNAAGPLVDLMQRKYDPHHIVIVTCDRIEVLSGVLGTLLETGGEHSEDVRI